MLNLIFENVKKHHNIQGMIKVIKNSFIKIYFKKISRVLEA